MAKDIRLQAVQQVVRKLDDDPDFAEMVLALCANRRLATGEVVDLHDPIETNGDTFAAVADDGALCLIDTANGCCTVNGKEVVRGRMGFVQLAPQFPAFMLYEGEKRRLVVVFGEGQVARSNAFDEITMLLHGAPYCFGARGEDCVLLTFDRERKEIVECCRARRIITVFEDGGLVLRADAHGKRSILNTRSGDSWRIDVDCEVVRAVSFRHGVAIFVKMPGGSQRIIWAFIGEEAFSFFGGEIDGYGGKDGVTCGRVFPQAFGTLGPFLAIGANDSLYTVTSARERDGGAYCGIVTDVSVFPYVVTYNRRYEVGLWKPLEKKLEPLCAFDRPPQLVRIGDHLVVCSPFPKEPIEVRWGDHLQHAVMKRAWQMIDFDHAHVMERDGFSKLVVAAKFEDGGPWQITDGLVKYGPTVKTVIRTLPSADGKFLRVWGWNGNTLVSFTATVYS